MGFVSIILIIILVISVFVIWAVAESESSDGCAPLLVALLVAIACCVGLYFTGDLATVLEYV